MKAIRLALKLKTMKLSVPLGASAQAHNSTRAWSRRQFVRAAAMTGAAVPLLSACTMLQPASPRVVSTGTLRHACIGVGGMGWVDLQSFQKHRSSRSWRCATWMPATLDNAAKAVPGARIYTDWRELLEKEGDQD